MSADIGKELFQKGTEAYHNKKYSEALKFFEESLKTYKEEATEVYIKSCKKKINLNSESKTTTQAPTPEETKGNPEQDLECEKILAKKDYYEILGVTKEATEEEIKRAYKKMAIKFHPDKNQSSHAAEAFKKISHAFTTLKDPEKKQFYDKYGSEEEYRAKYHQEQYQGYDENEMDPFDLFEMFFSGNQGFYQRNGRIYRRQAQRYPEQEQQQHQRVRPNRVLVLAQLLPFFVLILFSVVPYLLQTKPYYQFFRDEDYYKKMTTSANKIDYYVGDKFIKTFTKNQDIFDLEPQIEKDYLTTLSHQCAQLIKYKNELEYKLSYYRHSTYRIMIENELRNLDFAPCERYYKYRDVIYFLIV